MGNRVVFVNTLDQLRDEFGRLMDYLSEGWHYLRERAGKALKRLSLNLIPYGQGKPI